MQPIDTAPVSGDQPSSARRELPTASLTTGPGAGQSAVEHDALTGLADRESLLQHLAAALELPGAASVGVLRCDVDRFDWINTALGLAGGDEALRRIADVLSAACPSPAVVGRLGDDEFVIVLPELRDPEELSTLVLDLEERFRPALMVNGNEAFVALSFGSAVAPRADPTASSASVRDRIMHEAGSAMHRVKERRRGEGPRGSGADLLQLDADLHHALDRDEIIASFQPQYDSRDGTLTGYEALARWHHPEHGTLSPDRFIPLAETDGLIHRLGDSVLQQACRFADLVAAGRTVEMEVNVSTHQLTVPGLADRVRRVLAGYPDRTWTLTLEITESTLIRDRDLVLNELGRIRNLGVGVSIDDFGSGYSSLSQLRDLPATELKIDRSFVQQEDAAGRGVLAAIVALARTLDLAVVAEGIETGSQLVTLSELGCDRLQGMYLSAPLPAEDALAARMDITALLPSHH